MIMETVCFTAGIIILFLGIAIGMYLSSQIEKEINNNIKKK